MRERVLITGASGFIGYHLIEEALKQNLEVYAAVRKSSKIDHLKHLDIKFTYLRLSETNELTEDIEKNKYDYIIHAAGVTRSWSQAQYNHINATYTANLANAAALKIKKFVFLSSLAAAGPLKTLNGMITESTEPHPVTAYGQSKLLAEKKLSDIPNLNYTILRPTAVYGPRETGIYNFVRQVNKGVEPYIGNHPQKLSFVYVKDLASVTVKALYGGNYKTYNISDGNFYDRYELGAVAGHLLDIKPKKIHLPVTFAKFLALINEKVGSLNSNFAALTREKVKELAATNWACSIETAKQELGFYPQYNLDRGMEETIRWYKANGWL